VPPIRPRVAVITPCLDVAPYLAQAIESVLAQRVGELEYVVVDDGSTDGSAELADALAARDPRLRVVRHTTRRGLGVVRNTGLAATTAPVVAFLDGDDVWDPRFLATLLARLDQQGPACLAAFAWSRIIDAGGAPTGELLAPRAGRYDLRAMMEGICPPGNGSSLVIRRDALAGGFVTTPQGSDSETWLAMLDRTGGYFHCVPRALVCYRRRAGSLSSGSQRARVASLDRRLRTYGGRLPDRRAHAAFARYGFAVGEGDDPRVRAWLAEARRVPLRRRLATIAGLELELVAHLGWPLASRILATGRAVAGLGAR
jgi:glycosyltransferase involved in cell wall biosynthesis